MRILTDADKTLLPMALREHGGFHLATQWYFGIEPLPWQYAAHHARQLNVTIKAGIASGKTLFEAFSGIIDCLSIPYFKFLNTSVTAKQAELPFDAFMGWYEGNKRLEHLVDDIRLRPWPLVKFKNFSEFECRTAGTDARFIRGTEYDRINFDECGLDMEGEIVKVLRGRLRGRRPDGTLRMARMDCTSSPTDAPWWIERFQKGWKHSGIYDPLNYISFKVRTYDNTRLSPEQIRLMEAEYTDEMIDVEMNAEDPDYGLSFLAKTHINACTSQALNDVMYLATQPEEGAPKKGWRVEEHPRHGIVLWEMGYDPHGIYILAGDPGIDDPPKNNSGVVVCFEASKKPYTLVYFHWVSGHGSYIPWLTSYKYALQKYRPAIKLLDTTGTQKAIQELAFETEEIETDAFNFSRDKEGALNTLSLMVSAHDLQWPVIKGLIRQLSTYTKELDKDKDFPKDITMAMAMAAYGLRFAPNFDDTPVMPIRPRPIRGRRYAR